MLSRTLRHSRSAPSLRAMSPGPPQQGQITHLHQSSATKTVAQQASPLTKQWREKTVVELKAELKRRGLPTTGKKDELVTRLSNANANFGTAEAFGATSSVSPTKALKSESIFGVNHGLIDRAKKSMPTLRSSTPATTSSTFTTPVKAPPLPKIPDLYNNAPTVAPILKLNTQSLTASMANLRIGTNSPMSPAIINKGSFANLRAASTLTPTKSSSSPTISPKTSRSNLRRQSTVTSNPSTPTPNRNPSTTKSQLRHASTIAPASILTAKPTPSSTTTPSTSSKKLHSAPSSPSKLPKPRSIHTSTPQEAMLCDNVHLPTFTAEVPIEVPRVPILPTTYRSPPPIEIETPMVEHPIITAAGAHTHPAPPGGGSDHARQHLQSDSSKPRMGGDKVAENQGSRFEGDWAEGAEATGEGAYKFVPEEGEIPVSDRGILWGVVGAATLWGVFGPGKKDRK